MITLDRNAALDIANGAAFLSCGGGGTLSSSLKMIRQHFPASATVAMASVDEVAADPTGLTAACTFIGSPTAGKDVTNPKAVSNAFKRFAQLTQQRMGKTIKWVIPLELGVQSSVVPALLVAHENSLGVVDADGASRPIMGLQYTTFSTGGLSPNPGILANGATDSLVIETDDPADFTEVAFGVCNAASFGVAGLALWAMDGPTLKRVVRAVGTVGLALKVGTAMRGPKPVKDVLALFAPRWAGVLLEGKIVSVESKVQDYSTITLQMAGGVTATIMTYGSSALVYRSDRSLPVAMSPDSICWITHTGDTLSNTELPIGAEAVLVGIASERFLREGTILAGFDSYRVKLGYGGKYVPIEDLQKDA
jgi:DUF917 family protein